MKSVLHAAWGVVAVLLSASSAVACPFCESETGQQVKAGIFNDQFLGNVLLTLLPFPILLAIVALIYFDVRWPWRRQETNGGTAKLVAPLPTPGE